MERLSNSSYIVELARSLNGHDTKRSAAQMILDFLHDNKGYGFTSYELNRVGRTVDARKYISRLREKNEIKDSWVVENGKNFKYYYVQE